MYRSLAKPNIIHRVLFYVLLIPAGVQCFSFTPPSPASTATSTTGTRLFPYQQHGVERLLSSKRLLLADQMGLGKTVMCIEAMNQIALQDMRPEKEIAEEETARLLTILIICPKSVLGVWNSELETWLHPHLLSLWSVQVATTKEKPDPHPGSITLINYDICHKLQTWLHKQHYDILICDEAHYLKSIDSKRTKSILGTKKKAATKTAAASKAKNAGIQSEYLWLLTGTPVLNRPVELFPLVHAIAPTEFGSFEEYANSYCNPKSKAVFTKHKYPITVKDYSGSANLDELSQRLEPIMLRRYKRDVLSQLPPKFRTYTCLSIADDNDVDMDIAQLERQKLKEALQEYFQYNGIDFKDEDDDDYDDDDDAKITTTKKIPAISDMELDEFCSNADKLMKYIDKSPTATSNAILAKVSQVRQETAFLKLKPSIALLEEYIMEEKVVVFAHHRAVLDALLEHFGPKQAVAIKGGMSRESRDTAVHRFQNDDDVRLFVGSIRAAGVGVTLTAASHVIFLELDWSPGVMTQAEDRCHRVGQANSVRIQYFVFKGTIDEWLSKALFYKQSTIDDILPEKQGGTDATGYVFTFGKHKGLRLQDTPRKYVQFLLKREVWRGRPDLWRAMSSMGIVSEEPPPPPLENNNKKSTSDFATQQQQQQQQQAQHYNNSHDEVHAMITEELKEVEYVFDFGRYKGKKWEQVPESYREWLMREKVWKSNPRQNLREALIKAGFKPQ